MWSPCRLKKLQYMSILCNVNEYYHNIPKIDTIDEGFYAFLREVVVTVFLKTGPKTNNFKGAPTFFKRCLWMRQDYPCEKIFQPLYTDEGLCFTFNMLRKGQMFTSHTYDWENDPFSHFFKCGFRENIDRPPDAYNDQMSINWSADFGYTEDAEIETYPRRALLSGSTNSLEVTLSVNNTDLDYGCTHFQGYKVKFLAKIQKLLRKQKENWIVDAFFALVW